MCLVSKSAKSRRRLHPCILLLAPDSFTGNHGSAPLPGVRPGAECAGCAECESSGGAHPLPGERWGAPSPRRALGPRSSTRAVAGRLRGSWSAAWPPAASPPAAPPPLPLGRHSCPLPSLNHAGPKAVGAIRHAPGGEWVAFLCLCHRQGRRAHSISPCCQPEDLPTRRAFPCAAVPRMVLRQPVGG